MLDLDNVTPYDPPPRRQTVQMVRDGDEVVIEMSRLGDWTPATVKVIVRNGIATLVVTQGEISLASQLVKLRKD